jgi:hypothetical protein
VTAVEFVQIEDALKQLIRSSSVKLLHQATKAP